jgi:hypothetical protein
MRIQHRSAQRHSIFRGSIAYPTQLLCTLRSGRHLPPRNTRYEAAAKPYLGRTFHRLEHASLLGALAAYLLQRMNTLDCEWVSCRRITVVEWQLTLSFYGTSAQLNPNRFVDRQHAVVALPYCGFFLTDDADLRKRCNEIRQSLWFPCAEVLGEAEFFARGG